MVADQEEKIQHSKSIVTFENVTETVNVSKDNYDPDPTFADLIGEEGRSKEAHSITDFLATPRLPSQGVITWTTVQSVGTEIGFLPFPQVFFQSDMVKKKLSNFRFLYPGTSCIRLVVNANRFAVGRLLLVWEPCPFQRGYMSPINHLTSWSAYPHAEYDVGLSNEVVMKMPFVADRMWYDLLHDDFQYGAIRIFVLNQLRVASGSNNASVKVWCWMENVQVAVRTYNPTGAAEYEIETQAYREKRPKKSRQIRYRSSEGNSISSSGVISGPLWTISKVAGAVANVVPKPFSFIGNAIEWVSKLGATTASALGYSRPQSHRVVTPMVEYPGLGYTNHNGLENGAVLAFDALNSLNVDHSVFGVDQDEMDLSYICGKSTFYRTLSWSTLHVSNAVLASFYVNPGLCSATSVENIFAPTLLAYVASMFTYWRGSIQFDFSVVANAFYSGTLGFCYLPGVFFNDFTIDNETLETLPRILCDLRETTECSVTCDFTSQWEYLFTSIGSVIPTNPNYSPGSLVIYVVNPLVAPDTVPSAIDINVWISSKDMEFAVPTNYQSSSRRIPTRTLTPLVQPDDESWTGIETQGIDDSPPEGIIKPMNSSHEFVTMVSDDTLAAQMCIGEKVVNLRQLTRRFGYLANLDLTDDSSVCRYANATYYNYDDPQYTSECFYAYIAQIYAFFRGSVKYKLYVNSSDSVDRGWIRCLLFSGSAPLRTGTFNAGASALRFEHTQFLNVNPFMEITVPFYNPVHVRLITNLNRGTPYRIPAYYSSEVRNVTILSALGDDASFGFLVGPPYIRIV